MRNYDFLPPSARPALFEASFREGIDQLKFERRADLDKKISMEDVIEIAVAAQQKQALRNEEKQWVLKGAVRDGLLLFRPHPEKGLVRLRGEGLEMGSHRIPSDYFKPRLSWIQDDGKVVLEPDFSLSTTGSKLQDFIEWSFKNPRDSEEPYDIEGELEEELELPLKNSLHLRLSPEVRGLIKRAKKDETFQDLLKSARQKAKRSKIRAASRRFFRSVSLKELLNPESSDF